MISATRQRSAQIAQETHQEISTGIVPIISGNVQNRRYRLAFRTWLPIVKWLFTTFSFLRRILKSQRPLVNQESGPFQFRS